MGERVLQLAELGIGWEVDAHVELPSPEPCQPASDHVNRPEGELREDHGDEGCNKDGPARQPELREHFVFELLSNQKDRDADSYLSEVLIADEQWRPVLECELGILAADHVDPHDRT